MNEVAVHVEIGAVLVPESRQERYRAVAGYGGWDDGMPLSMDLDRKTGWIIVGIINEIELETVSQEPTRENRGR